MKIKINEHWQRKAKEFADERMSGSKGVYKMRGEQRNSKIWSDIYVGALGEIAVHLLHDTTAPDFEIYEQKNKSFECDLKNNAWNIHVKSQDTFSQKRYGHSWILQKSDRLTSHPKGNDLIIFTCVDKFLAEVELLGAVRALDICNNNLWGECKVPSYRHSKVALYLDDLEEILMGDLK